MSFKIASQIIDFLGEVANALDPYNELNTLSDSEESNQTTPSMASERQIATPQTISELAQVHAERDVKAANLAREVVSSLTDFRGAAVDWLPLEEALEIFNKAMSEEKIDDAEKKKRALAHFLVTFFTVMPSPELTPFYRNKFEGVPLSFEYIIKPSLRSKVGWPAGLTLRQYLRSFSEVAGPLWDAMPAPYKTHRTVPEWIQAQHLPYDAVERLTMRSVPRESAIIEPQAPPPVSGSGYSGSSRTGANPF